MKAERELSGKLMADKQVQQLAVELGSAQEFITKLEDRNIELSQRAGCSQRNTERAGQAMKEALMVLQRCASALPLQ